MAARTRARKPPHLIAIDTETQGLRPFQGDKAIMASFADDTGVWAEPADQAGETVRRLVDEGAVIIMHNSPYDRAVFSANWNVEIPDDRIRDTMARDWMLDENADHRLKEGLGVRLFGEDAKAEKQALTEMMRGRRIEDVYRELREVENVRPRKERERATETRQRAREIAASTRRTWETMTFDDLLPYAEQDANLTWRAYWHQEGAFQDDPYTLPDHARQHLVGGLCYRINRAGVRVDEARAARGLEEAEARVAELREKFDVENLGSAPQVSRMLYEDWKLPVVRRTPSGAPSTDKVALEALAYDARVADLMEFRRLTKQVDAYYLPLLDRIGPDGRIHPSLSAWRTRTGRFSCSGPNLQTIPRDSTSTEIRKVFIPADGMVLTEWDLSQIEPRLATEMSQEPALLDVYDTGRDIYQEMADAIGVDRQQAKRVILSALYGVGGKTLANHLAVGTGKPPDVRRARAILNRYWRAYPELRRLMQGLEGVAKRRGYLPLWKEGRRRLYRSPHVKFPKFYTALNSALQGGAAELLKDILLELEPAIAPYGRIVLTVHDSIVVEHEPGADRVISKVLDEITYDVTPFAIETPWEAKQWR